MINVKKQVNVKSKPSATPSASSGNQFAKTFNTKKINENTKVTLGKGN